MISIFGSKGSLYEFDAQNDICLFCGIFGNSRCIVCSMNVLHLQISICFIAAQENYIDLLLTNP